MGKRAINQDYVEFFVNQSDQLLAILCDGMGGHKAGDIASEMAVLQLGHRWEQTACLTTVESQAWLEKHINIENQRIYRVAKRYTDLDGMGTTLVAAAFINGDIIIGNIGDSRAYQLTKNQLRLVTVDHSFANELRLSGEITEDEARTHRQRHALTRSLGVFDKVKVDFFILNTEETSLIMLCSDGLSNELEETAISSILEENGTLEEKASQLVEQALLNGSTDNITVCLIDPHSTNEEAQTVKGKEESR
nr:Stp1/IreP family PP2C-type Ser/Thr phosphatase [Alkalibacterium sp. MB6]